MSLRIILPAYQRIRKEIMLLDYNRGTLTTFSWHAETIVMPAVSSCSTQVCKVLVLLLQSDVDPHIETRGIRGLSGGFTLLCI